MGKKQSDEFRKAEFRERARDIVQTDREKRKWGMPVDTAGAIARAMEKAYQRGRKEEREGEPEYEPTDDSYIEWLLIPPRPRMAFWSICLNLLGQEPQFRTPEGGIELMRDSRNRRYRWVLMSNWDEEGPYTQHNMWGPKTIKPLIARGLLAETDETRAVLTEKGIASWREALLKVDYDCAMIAY